MNDCKSSAQILSYVVVTSRMRLLRYLAISRTAALVILILAISHCLWAQDVVQTAEGRVSGQARQPNGVRAFLGIPFAKPPIGDLRWRAPQPVQPWSDVRPANNFGARCIQAEKTTDIVTRAPGMSEDCLYLNVWTPAKSAKSKLPVLVYIYGGGFVSGDSSENRYDGAALAAQGIVFVSMNYRLGIFGFMAMPELSQESEHHVSGNYGLLDQLAALQWVKRNVAAFGGDPNRVTIAGESAGSMSVSAHMVSPLSKGLLTGAIGESGSVITGAFPFLVPLSQLEATGTAFEQKAGASSLVELRAIPANTLQDTYTKLAANGMFDPHAIRFTANIDGYFFPRLPEEMYASGDFSHVPLLAGSNSEEGGYNSILGEDDPTIVNYKKALADRFGSNADEAFHFYPAASDGEAVKDAAQMLSSDLFIGYSTWKWVSLSSAKGNKPVFYYYYAHPRAPVRPEAQAYFDSWWQYNWHGKNYPRAKPRGAVHSAEIEYALGNLSSNSVYAWGPNDELMSKTAQAYFLNFIKTGSPNGKGEPNWPVYSTGKRMVLDVNSSAEPDGAAARYQFLEKTIFNKKK